MVVDTVKKKEKFVPKGKYVILVEDNEDGTKTVISTDSLFWYNFYGGDRTEREN
jgi:hypothetical protein